jgi:micrococcal nuclease
LTRPDPGFTAPDLEHVQHVIDGDRLVLGTGERVRLIGVDTPETNHPEKPVEYFAKEAAAFRRRMAEVNNPRLRRRQ